MNQPQPPSKPILVTKSFLPPLEDYVGYLKGIWERGWLTNHGPLVHELEEKLQTYHGLPMPVYSLTNGALGLQIALKALGVKGEVVTTPFSYVATTACPLWEGCTVKYADIEPDTLTIEPRAVEAAISPGTEAIMTTHVFGNPCDVEALGSIAEKHGLALIYDAAHAFGVRYQGKSILEWGDISMVSLHATKVFHTIEGGFMVARDAEVSKQIEWMRRFGHQGLEKFHGVGINAKMSEFQAAMGLCNLQHIDHILAARGRVVAAYDAWLKHARTVRFAFRLRDGTQWNNAYYPVLFDSEALLLQAVRRLAADNITPRRYFHPSLEQAIAGAGTGQPVPVSADIASRILCLPLFAADDLAFVERVTAGLE